MNTTMQFQKAKPFPGPKGYPLVGLIPKIRGSFIHFVTQMWLEYGDCLRLDMGKVEMYCVVHPDDVKHVLQMNNRNYAKGHKNQVKVLFGNGLFSSEGEFWRQQRRLIQPLFNRRTLASYAPAIIATTAEMLAKWEARNQAQALDIANEMRRVTQRVITRTMFSKDMSEQTDVMCQAFAEALHGVNSNMRRPDFMSNWPLPSNRRFDKAINTIDETVYKLIAERRASDASHASDNAEEDLLSLLLNVRDEESGAKMSDQQIRDELTTMFLAGHETTATGLTWTWYLLSRHPVVAEKVVTEIDHVLQEAPTAEDLAKLTYTRQVFSESLRLYPPVWRFVRLAEADDVLPSGYGIPKGSMVILLPYLTHRHPDFWPNPEGFQPARFTPPASKSRHRYAYLPFGGGPRLCIGNNFSLMEGPLMMAMILQQYNLTLLPGSNVQMKPNVVRPLNGIPMRVTRRTDGPTRHHLI